MSKLSSQEDIDKTSSLTEGTQRGNIIRLEAGHNFILLLNEDYEEGFVHWVHVGEKDTYRRPCKADINDQGWDPDSCELCALTLEMFELKKEAKDEGDKILSDEYNTRGNKLKAGYTAVFQAVKFKALLERKKDKKHPGKYIKVWLPDYEEFEVGKLSLSSAACNKLVALAKKDPETGEMPFSFIKSGTNLVYRTLDFVKKKQAKKKYAELEEIRPSKKTMEDFEVSKEDIPDLSHEFDVKDDFDKVIGLYKGEMEGIEEEKYTEEDLELEEKEESKSSKKGGKKSKKEVEADEF